MDFNISFLVMKQTVCCCSLSLHGLDVFLQAFTDYRKTYSLQDEVNKEYKEKGAY